MQLLEAGIVLREENIQRITWDGNHKKCYVNRLHDIVLYRPSELHSAKAYSPEDWGVSEKDICVNHVGRSRKRRKRCPCQPCRDKRETGQSTRLKKTMIIEDTVVVEDTTSSSTPSLTSDSEGTQADRSIEMPAGSPTSARTAAKQGSTEESATTTEPEDKSSRERLQRITDLMQDMQNDTTSLDKVLAYMESIRHDTASSSIGTAASIKS